MKIYYLLLLILLFTSCGSSKYSVENFSQLTDITSLDGTYYKLDEKQSASLSYFFGFSSDSIEFVNLKFSKKNLIVTVHTNSGMSEKSYKGKLKENYFEIYLRKRIMPVPVIYSGWCYQRIRIGRDKDKNLLVQYWRNAFAWVLMMATAGDDDSEYVFRRVED